MEKNICFKKSLDYVIRHIPYLYQWRRIQDFVTKIFGATARKKGLVDVNRSQVLPIELWLGEINWLQKQNFSCVRNLIDNCQCNDKTGILFPWRSWGTLTRCLGKCPVEWWNHANKRDESRICASWVACKGGGFVPVSPLDLLEPHIVPRCSRYGTILRHVPNCCRSSWWRCSFANCNAHGRTFLFLNPASPDWLFI